MSQTFVHLRVHTEYSVVDGLVRIKPLVNRVAALGMPAVAVTEQSNLCSLVKFYKGCNGAGVKPIIGADIWLENLEEPDKPSRLPLLARNDTGYRHLMELISQAYTQGQRLGKPVVQREWLAAKAEGLIALSGARDGEIGRAMLAGKHDQARERLAVMMALFPNAFYLELQRTGRPFDEECVHLSVAMALATACPVVATNDVHFISAGDFEAHEVRVCINEGRTLDDPRRDRRFSEQQYLRSPAEMIELFSDIPEAIENTVHIAARCSVNVELGKAFLPNYPIPEGMTTDEFFRKISQDGLEDRLRVVLDPAAEDYQARRTVYQERLNFELDIIIQMGFPGYFLIVMDFIQWAKNNGIPVGPGRGSGAGSVVAWVQKITDLDPLQYDLLFERFLNPERVSMPDFDVDFCMDKRDRVIDYVKDKYGHEAVSQIITFGTMAAKAVVRDVARVQGKSYGLADKLSKLIPFEVGMTLEKAIEQEPALKSFLQEDEDAQEIWEMGLKLEGIIRNAGKHAGGVVIAPTRLTDFSALYCEEGGANVVTQFDKNDVEECGLVKFDFLGLRTLTIIDWALKMINPRRMARGETVIDIDRIPLDDAQSFALLKRAETTAVFQLESRGMKDLVRRLQPDCLEDMIALVALFRPGPLQSGMVDDFIDRKHGKQPIAYPHQDFQYEGLKPVLQPTYGIILYQEQVMQIAQVMAGYTLGGADMLRRAMGKKKPEEMAKQKAGFIEGCEASGIDKKLAENIFDLVEKFAGYGFNKSHSAAYALVSYQTLWLKAHYPAEFMAAVLTADMQNTDKVVTLVDECRKLGLTLVLPDVNRGEFVFTVDDDGRIIYGLGAIKGLGEAPVQSLVDARNAGEPFRDVFDFCARVDLKKVNRRALEALIRSGAMDDLGPSRSILMASLDKAIQQAEQADRNSAVGIGDLFGESILPTDEDPFAPYRQLRDWSPRERLNGEKETLGLYVTGHPFDEHEKEVRRLASTPLSEVRTGKGQKVGGMVLNVRTVKSKRGSGITIVTLDDRSGRIDFTLFDEAWQEVRHFVRKDEVLIVEGEISVDDFSGGFRMRAFQVTNLAGARVKHGKGLLIQLDAASVGRDLLAKMEETLQPFRANGCAVFLDYRRADARGRLRLSDQWKVNPSDELLQGLAQLLGRESVSFVYD